MTKDWRPGHGNSKGNGGSKIIIPFKPSATLTIELNEETGQANVKASKPMSAAFIFEACLAAARSCMHQVLAEHMKLQKDVERLTKQQ